MWQRWYLIAAVAPAITEGGKVVVKMKPGANDLNQSINFLEAAT